MEATTLELLMYNIDMAEHNSTKIDVEFNDEGKMVQIDHNPKRIDPAKDFLKETEKSDDYMTARYLATRALYYGEAFPELLKVQAIASAFGLTKKLNKTAKLDSVVDALYFVDSMHDEFSQKLKVDKEIDTDYVLIQTKRNFDNLKPDEKKEGKKVLRRLYSLDVHPHNSEEMVRNAGRILGYSKNQIDFHVKHSQTITAMLGLSMVGLGIFGLSAGMYGIFRLGEAIFNGVR